MPGRVTGKKCFIFLAAALCGMFGMVSCSNTMVERTEMSSLPLVEGNRAVLRNGVAYAPKNAPDAVKRAIAAGNRLQGKPYKWGGGHGRYDDRGYDCSGTVSYVLRHAGLMDGCLTSSGYFKYGKSGPGRWISIYTRRGHVYLTVAGLRLDTGGPGGRTGPKWRSLERSTRGQTVRHPAGY